MPEEAGLPQVALACFVGFRALPDRNAEVHWPQSTGCRESG